MKIEQVFVIGMQNAEQRSALLEAVRTAFGDIAVTALDHFSQAQAWSPGKRALLVLVEPAPSLAAGAKTGLGTDGLPRWITVVVSRQAPEAGIDWVRPEELSPGLLARVLAGAVEKHALMREMLRLRGDLLTVARRVNHDLRSSLNGVVTAAEVIKEILGAEKPEDLELVQPVADSAAEIARLIDQVSFVAKATALPQQPQPVAMDELVWKGLGRVERRIHDRKAHVAHAEVWPVATGVGAWIETIWAELVANALDHTGANPHVELGWSEDGAGHRFWVDDRGPGVPVEKRAVLFTPFNRLSEPGSARGFGLSIVQRLTELQGGTCGYEAREGGGARFYFTLPKG